ncbi:MAG: pitrilysin family protein [Cyanobacteria bacterium P01_H01_bin.74]
MFHTSKHFANLVLFNSLVILVSGFLASDSLISPPALADSNSHESVLKSDLLKAGIVKKILPNGHTIIIKPDHRFPVVTIDTWVKVGSVNENSENNGVSHFLEHLLFKGTPNYPPGEIDRLLESNGATFNAATSDDFTHYYIKIAPQHLNLAIQAHADMLMNASIPPDELLQERKVVQEEINRANDNPSRQVYNQMTQSLFAGHGYAMDTLGPKKNIVAISRQNIFSYYRWWYQPNNLTTVIVGDVDSDTALKAVAKSFSEENYFDKAQAQKKKSNFLDSKNPNEAHQANQPTYFSKKPNATSIVLKRSKINQAYLAFGFLGPSAKSPEDAYALDIAMMALDTGKSARLNQALIEKEPLATGVSASNITQKYAGMIYITAQAAPENRKKVKEIIVNELLLLAEKGISDLELEKAKTQYLKHFIFENESTSGTASHIGYNVVVATLDDYLKHQARVKQVTKKAVQDALKRYILPAHAVLVELVPDTVDIEPDVQIQQNIQLLKEAAQTRARQSKPVQGVDNTPQGNETLVKKQRLANGLTLITRSLADSETVSFEIFVKGGQRVESKPGLSDLLSAVLFQGTTSRSKKVFQAELDSLGLSLTAAPRQDYFSISGSAVKADLGELFLLLKDGLENPALKETEIAKQKIQLVQAIVASEDTPATVVLNNLRMALYPNHPYGNVGARVKHALPQISRASLLKYYEDYFQPSNMVVSVVGHFNEAAVINFFNNLLLKEKQQGPSIALSKGADHLRDTARQLKVKPLEAEKTVIKKRPKLSALWISQGWLMPPLSETKAYVTVKLINTILGQGMSSRLFTELREKHGLAYAVGSFYPTLAQDSYFATYIGTDPKNKAQVIQGLRAEINRLKTSLVSEKELAEAKSKLVGSFALAHENNASQAFYLGLYEVLGKGHQFDKQYPELVKSITSADIRATAKKYFSQPRVLSAIEPKVESGISQK